MIVLFILFRCPKVKLLTPVPCPLELLEPNMKTIMESRKAITTPPSNTLLTTPPDNETANELTAPTEGVTNEDTPLNNAVTEPANSIENTRDILRPRPQPSVSVIVSLI